MAARKGIIRAARARMIASVNDAILSTETTQASDLEAREKFATGAVRSRDTDGVRYDLLCPTANRRLAARHNLGSLTYGDFNWQKGMPIGSTLNHLHRHLALWESGDRSDDHLAAVAWGVSAIMHFEDGCGCGGRGAEYARMLDSYLEAVGGGGKIEVGQEVAGDARQHDNPDNAGGTPGHEKRGRKRH